MVFRPGGDYLHRVVKSFFVSRDLPDLFFVKCEMVICFHVKRDLNLFRES